MDIEIIKGMHPGYRSIPFEALCEREPLLKPILLEAPLVEGERYTVDVKVHMLMPGQYPCIPNWHFDCVPRGKDGKKDFKLIDLNKTMFLWVSGSPLPVFKIRDGSSSFRIEPVPIRKWYPFTQIDEHRGVESTSFTWRLFMRIAPESLKPPKPESEWVRLHSQVYLDAKQFEW